MKSYHSYLQKREYQAFASSYPFANNTNLLKAVPGGRLNTAALLPATGADPFSHLLKLFPLQEDDLSLSAFAERTKAAEKEAAFGLPVTKQVSPENLFSQSTFMTWLVAEDNSVVYANQGFFRFFNIESNDLTKKISQLIPGAVREKISDAYLKVRISGAPYKNVVVYPKADGSATYFLVTIYPCTDSHTKNCLAAEAIDITHCLQLFRQITWMNEQLTNLLSITTDSIWEYDIPSGYLFQNEKLAKLTDTTAGKISDLNGWYNLIHLQDRTRAKEKIETALNEKKTTWEQEYRIKSSDKSYITLKEQGFITYQNGEATKIVASLRNISEIKALQAEITHEKSNHDKKLAEATLLAQEKERTRIGNELHDNVNQLLASSKLFLELVKPIDDESDNLKTMVGQYIETAVKEIRNLSHGLVATNFDQTGGLIGSFNKILDDLSSTNTFSISFVSDKRIESLKNSKKITLFRIFQEQLKNIIKHSKATKINVELSLANNKALLSIKDNGVGFNSQLRRKGIGVSSIYNRAKLHNGSVEFVTSPGNGCELKVLFPTKTINHY